MDNSLIKRQDAIDEVVAWLKDRMTDRKNGKPLTDRLKDLPSAQPLVLHCTDCEDWHTKQGVWGISVSDLPSAQPERKMCNLCKYYGGVHRVQGHAPCSFWEIGGVMYDDYCSRWEEFDG